MLDLYKNIKKYREALKMTQSQLAEKLGYADKSIISKIEKGAVDLTQSKIVAFANVFGVPPCELMGWVDSSMPSSALSPDEELLLTGYHKLNDVGKKQLHKQLSMMLIDKDYVDSTEDKKVIA